MLACVAIFAWGNGEGGDELVGREAYVRILPLLLRAVLVVQWCGAIDAMDATFVPVSVCVRCETRTIYIVLIRHIEDRSPARAAGTEYGFTGVAGQGSGVATGRKSKCICGRYCASYAKGLSQKLRAAAHTASGPSVGSRTLGCDDLHKAALARLDCCRLSDAHSDCGRANALRPYAHGRRGPKCHNPCG